MWASILALYLFIWDWNPFLERLPWFITASKQSLRRLCFYTCLSFCPRGEGGGVGGGGIPACIVGGIRGCLAAGGGWYPSMPCRFPGSHPGGKLRGLAGGVSRPTPGGGGVSTPTPRGVYPSMHWGSPPGRLLLRVVRILLEWILVNKCKQFNQSDITSDITTWTLTSNIYMPRASSSYFFLLFSAYSYFSYFLAISSYFSYFLAILLTISKYLLEIWTF